MKLFKYTVFLFLVVFTSCFCFAQKKQDTLNILFVGNSYTYVSNIPHLVSLISDSTQTKLKTAKSTSPGVRLSEHWRGEKGLKTKELIKNGNFDIVVLQEHHRGTLQQPDSFLIYAKKFSDYIRVNGAQPYFYSTWAREKEPQFQKTITDLYDQAAKENDAGIVLVGEAWARAQKYSPEIKLYQSDGSHQSPIGAFLSACMFVKALAKELPEQLRVEYVMDTHGESIWLMYIYPPDLTLCQKVVNEMSR